MSGGVRRGPLAVPKDLSLLVLSGPETGRCFAVPPGGAIVGREEGADLQIDDSAISRRHAEIVITPEHQASITDLGSANGLFVEGVRCDEAPLHDGTHLQLGDTVLRVRFQPRALQVLSVEEREATMDPLTSLINRAHLLRRVELELAILRGHPTWSVTAIMLDLDHFRGVNDRYGRATGDAVLRCVAQRLATSVGADDIVARYGSDEFTVVSWSNSAGGQGLRLAGRLCQALREDSLQIGADRLVVTASVGVAIAEQGDAYPIDDANELLSRADAALYRRKRAGRDGVALWTSMSTSAKKRRPPRNRSTRAMRVPVHLFHELT